MQAGREFSGRCASPGVFAGDVYLAENAEGNFPAGELPASEQLRLDRSILKAIDELTALAATTDSQSAAILEFQIEMLMDPEILGETAELINSGLGAELAWVTAMDQYIASFQISDDEAVKARAVDMTDIRNRVLAVLAGRLFVDFPPGAVYAGHEMEPSLFLMHDWSKGGAIMLFAGSTASHVAMLARARSIPMIVATGPAAIASGIRLVIDATSGLAVVDDNSGQIAVGANVETSKPPGDSPASDDGRVSLPDGRMVEVSININDFGETQLADPGDIAGIGLLRSEFMLRAAADLADEERHYAYYRAIVDWVGQKPVTIRLLDLGGDKLVAGAGLTYGGANSSLGLRGIRLLLAKPEILRIQARAILRAAASGNVRVMAPMVTVSAEIEATRQIFEQEALALTRRGISVALPPIGMMVEVPAAAMMLETFQHANFFSLGTNDLGQYLAAAGRDIEPVQPLLEATMPALTGLIAKVADSARRMGKPLSICGDLAGDPEHLPDLIDAGLLQFSVAPSRLESLKSALTRLPAGQNRKDG